MTFKVGDRVSLKKSALSISYIAGRHWYTNMYEGKQGKIIGFTANTGYNGTSNKVAIEFDDVVFTRPDGKKSSHDNGCHGKGRVQYCWYIPAECIESAEISEDDMLLLLKN